MLRCLRPDAVVHDGGSDTTGADGFYPFYDRLRSTFSEIHVNVQDSFAEGDKLCVRWSCTAKHTGDGLGMAPTGVTINVTGITILRVAGGQLVEGMAELGHDGDDGANQRPCQIGNVHRVAVSVRE